MCETQLQYIAESLSLIHIIFRLVDELQSQKYCIIYKLVSEITESSILAYTHLACP
jgi:hypothetical protein